MDGCAEVRIGFNVLMLQGERGKLRGASAASLGAVLSGIADFYDGRIDAGKPLEPPDDLRQSIDDSLKTIALEDDRRGADSIDALVGLRRALFPDAAPPASWQAAEAAPQLLPLAAE